MIVFQFRVVVGTRRIDEMRAAAGIKPATDQFSVPLVTG